MAGDPLAAVVDEPFEFTSEELDALGSVGEAGERVRDVRNENSRPRQQVEIDVAFVHLGHDSGERTRCMKLRHVEGDRLEAEFFNSVTEPDGLLRGAVSRHLGVELEPRIVWQEPPQVVGTKQMAVVGLCMLSGHQQNVSTVFVKLPDTVGARHRFCRTCVEQAQKDGGGELLHASQRLE